MILSTCVAIVLAFFVPMASAQDVAVQQALDAQWPAIERRIPPKGIELDPLDRVKLESGLKAIKKRLEAVYASKDADSMAAILPDVEIYVKAVDLALENNEFYDAKDVNKAVAALRTANTRLSQVLQGKQPWNKQRGLVVRGYRSSIDGSVQPYGLHIPEDLILIDPVPVYVWLHGRGDKVTDLHFIDQRENKPGPVAPSDGITLHPFGRHCMGFKSAGEIDVLDALKSLAPRYRVDTSRVVLMGFSMGGAGAWHIGAHYPDQWTAVSPGAGFAETKLYTSLKVEDYPAWYEQKLWGVYDVPMYVRNLFNVPVIAYSGEKDKQIQAAQVMAEAFAEQGQTLEHIIGPETGHKYHPDALKTIMAKIERHVAAGQASYPRRVTLQTRTLRYSIVHWVMLLGMHRHWDDARVNATLAGDQRIEVTTKNATALLFWDPREDAPGFQEGFAIHIDGQELVFAEGDPVRDYVILVKENGQWRLDHQEAYLGDDAPLRKAPRLQGPIDDAFLESFLVVVPSGKSAHPLVDKWVRFELDHFLKRWRTLYRGEPRVVKDVDLSPLDVHKHHLILWGDRQSNQWIDRIADDLPIKWNKDAVTVGEASYAADRHVPVMIYPNPLSKRKYIVINSGPTHREAHDRTNSLQNPKLPDWAIVDITQRPDATSPGRIVDAAFFDEHWRYTKVRE